MGEGNQTKHPAWTSLNSQQGNAETERPSELNGLKTLCGYPTPTSSRFRSQGGELRGQQRRQSQLRMDGASSVPAESPQQAPQYARQPPTRTMKNQVPEVAREMSFHPFQICCHLIS